MKKNKMKMLGIVLLVITAVSVVLTFLIVAKLTHPAGEDSETQTVFKESVSGTIENVYVVSNQKNEVILLYRGKKYFANQTAENDYTGVADLELADGKIVHIYAKPQGISGILALSPVFWPATPGTPSRLRAMNLWPVWTTFRCM